MGCCVLSTKRARTPRDRDAFDLQDSMHGCTLFLAHGGPRTRSRAGPIHQQCPFHEVSKEAAGEHFVTLPLVSREMH